MFAGVDDTHVPVKTVSGDRPRYCPDGRWHGLLLPWAGGKFHCPHVAHGANGRFFDKADTR
ncbi:MAG: hypothetical protein H0W36_11090 [Gemmatimonadetes bacterium]|nr:hypothetical protein [Gemmatimonadota bacterium]